MESGLAFSNFTPLYCFPFDTTSLEGRILAVVVVKITLDLVAIEGPSARGCTHYLRLSQDQQPVRLKDAHHGEGLEGSLRIESEHAPAKPQCDVIFAGTAYAPDGVPHRRFPVRLRVLAAAKDAWTRPGQEEVLLDKCLQVTGERWLKRRSPVARTVHWMARMSTLGLSRLSPWKLTRPSAVASLPMRYEYAFGGHIKVHASEPWAKRVAQRTCKEGVDKTKALQDWEDVQKDGVLAEAWWDENTVGRGYAPAWFLKAARIKRLPAPQIEDPDHPFSAWAAWRASLGRDRDESEPALRAQGLGTYTRNWEPRLRYAGYIDETWVPRRDLFPIGYSPAFNNCAHPDLQCRHLAGDEIIELTNLYPPEAPGVLRLEDGSGRIRFQLPELYPFLFLGYESGDYEELPLPLDTLLLEPDEGRVTLLHRNDFAEEDGPEEVELRLAMRGEHRGVTFLPDSEPETMEAPHAP